MNIQNSGYLVYKASECSTKRYRLHICLCIGDAFHQCTLRMIYAFLCDRDLVGRRHVQVVGLESRIILEFHIRKLNYND